MSIPSASQTAGCGGETPRALLDIRDLRVTFPGEDGPIAAVRGVSFDVAPGETLCLLGESGSGKSITLKSIMRLLPRSATIDGNVRIDGVDVGTLDERGLQSLRGSVVAMIFQDPMNALDPVFTIGTQIAQAVTAHEGGSRAAARRRALELLELVQVPSAKDRLDAYPHELSGGLRQRAMIAAALSCRPRLLLADEPTTALDATVQIQILLLLRQLQATLGMACVLVTHDLGVACEVADRVAVMYAGRLVEIASVGDLIGSPRHPYTIGLLASTVTGNARGALLRAIPGSPPDLSAPLTACAFEPRCGQATAICRQENPVLRSFGAGRSGACHHVASEPA
jgi:peptide/nickel transport system ATP-binding protein